MFAFGLLLLFVRLLGKKQLDQLTFFTYITGIAMGNIAGELVVHPDVPLLNGFTGLAMWAILTFAVEFTSLKSPTLRVVLDGEPTIVIKRGEIMQKELAGLRLNMDDLSMMLRSKDVFSISEVDYAIFEPNGKLSVLKKPQHEGVSRIDLNINPTGRLGLPLELIVDGNLVEKNLQERNLTKEWLVGELTKAGYHSFAEVFFAELQSDGSLLVQKMASR